MQPKDSLEHRLLGLQDNMFNFALTLTASREEAKDLLQETTLRVLDNKEKYYENVNFKGWVFTIMHNIFVNNYRKIVRSQTIIDTSKNLYQLDMPQDSGFDTPAQAYSIKEINKAINSFANDYKVPFSMHVSGYKYEEIAMHLKLPIGTVKSRIFFARKKLQSLLKDFKFFGEM
ncbi:MAG: RNA polymerase sigma factor [Dysgonamonadaceae bacterium]|jgi:RNA polymerase sigma-70 factor (ECF subfamily)|nr:RNA polymerase sigma factor [Dysgonamonadaceae bacterium]